LEEEMKRFTLTLIIAMTLISALNAFWWDPPEKKAQTRVMKLENYGLKAVGIDGLRNLGWSLGYRRLTNEIINSGSVIIPILKSVILDKNKDWRARFLCVDQIIIVKDIDRNDAKKIILALLGVMNDNTDNKEVRREIANNFYWIGGRSGKMGETKLPTGHWADLLSSDDRRKIVEALINAGINKSEDHQVRWNSIRSLSVFSDFASVILDSISSFIDDPNEQIRASVVNTIGGIAQDGKKTEIEGLLIKVLISKGSHDLATEQALFWIKSLKVRTASPYLLESLKTERYCAKSSAAEILGVLEEREAVPFLIENATNTKDALLAYEAITALGRIGDPRAFETLISIAASDRSTNDDAARALGHLGDKRAIPVLITILQNDNTRNSVKKAASVSLMKLGAKSAIPLIERCINAGKKQDKRSWESIEKLLVQFSRGEDIEWED
jgi:hypothetical protein